MENRCERTCPNLPVVAQLTSNLVDVRTNRSTVLVVLSLIPIPESLGLKANTFSEGVINILRHLYSMAPAERPRPQSATCTAVLRPLKLIVDNVPGKPVGTRPRRTRSYPTNAATAASRLRANWIKGVRIKGVRVKYFPESNIFQMSLRLPAAPMTPIPDLKRARTIASWLGRRRLRLGHRRGPCRAAHRAQRRLPVAAIALGERRGLDR